MDYSEGKQKITTEGKVSRESENNINSTKHLQRNLKSNVLLTRWDSKGILPIVLSNKERSLVFKNMQ